MSFAIKDVLNALVKNIMAQTGIDNAEEACRLVNSGEWILVRREPKWTINADGTITLTVTSDGTTGPEWVTLLKSAGKCVSDRAEEILLSDEFQPTNGVTYKITILPGMLFSDAERITKKIRVEAVNRGLLTPHSEVACLLHMYLTDEEIKQLGLWWLVVMHEPIEVSGGDPGLLGVDRDVEGQWLSTCWGSPDGRWGRGGGFVFVSPAS